MSLVVLIVGDLRGVLGPRHGDRRERHEHGAACTRAEVFDLWKIVGQVAGKGTRAAEEEKFHGRDRSVTCSRGP
jgi:hypothetical protein